MKKLVLLVLACLLSVGIMSSSPVSAAGVDGIMVSDISLRTDDFVDIAKNNIGNGVTISQDNQEKYQKFWLSKGAVFEPKQPSIMDLVDYTRSSGAEKVLFLVTECELEASSTCKASVQVKGILVGPAGVMKSAVAVADDFSGASFLRAKRAAYELCIKKLASKLVVK